MILIGLSGKKRSGKNTVAKLIATAASVPVQEFAFADELKNEVCSLLHITRVTLEENKEMYRPFLQALGVLRRESINADYWVNKVGVKILNSSSEIVVITDVRFKNEAEFVRKCGGVVVRVNRGLSVDEHCSETELDDYKFDFVIDNNSTLNSLLEDTKRLLHNLRIPLKQN